MKIKTPVDVGFDVINVCLLYTSDAADDLLCVDLGGRRIIKKKHENTKATKKSCRRKHKRINENTTTTVYD